MHPLICAPTFVRIHFHFHNWKLFETFIHPQTSLWVALFLPILQRSVIRHQNLLESTVFEKWWKYINLIIISSCLVWVVFWGLKIKIKCFHLQFGEEFPTTADIILAVTVFVTFFVLMVSPKAAAVDELKNEFSRCTCTSGSEGPAVDRGEL